jgi:hypothetical protein
MNVIRKETNVIEFRIEGVDFLGDPLVQTIYDFAFKIDPIVNKPSFMINSTSQIIYPSNDRILFGCYCVFIFDNKKIMPTLAELTQCCMEGEKLINNCLANQLEEKTDLPIFKIQPFEQALYSSQLNDLIISNSRLN